MISLSESNQRFLKRISVLYGLFGFFLGIALGTDYTWDGEANGSNTSLWSAKQNWGNTSYPDADTDRAFFDSTSNTGNVFAVNVDGNYTVQSIDISTDDSADDYTFSNNLLSLSANTGNASINIGASNLGYHSFSTNILLGSDLDIDNASSEELLFSGIIYGTNDLTKTGSGRVVFSGNNSYSGSTQIDAGTLSISHSQGLGSTAGSSTVTSGGTLELDLSGASIGEDLILSGSGSGSQGALFNTGGNNSLTGTLTLSGGTDIGVDSGTTLTLSAGASISGSGGLTKIGDGSLFLTNSSTYTGETTVSEGYLKISTSNALGATGSGNGTIVDSGATLFLAGGGTTFGGGAETLELQGSGVVSSEGALYNSSGNNSWNGEIDFLGDTTVGVNTGTQLSFIKDISGSSITLTKTGDGSLQLSGPNSGFSGTYHVTEGDLILTKEQTASVAVVLDDTSGVDLIIKDDALIQNPSIGSLAGGGTTGGNVSINDNLLKIGSDNTSTTFSGVISGSTAANVSKIILQKDGSGTLTLTGANTFEGTLDILNGAIQAQNDAALGTTNYGTVVSSGAALELSNGGSGSLTLGEDVTLTGTGISNTGALRNVEGDNTISGTLTLNGANTYIGVDAGTSLNATGLISASDTLIKTGEGTLNFASDNKPSSGGLLGNIEVQEGTLSITHEDGLGTDLAHTTVFSGASVALDGVGSSEDFILNGSGYDALGALRNLSGTNTLSGDIDLNTNAAIGVDASSTMQLSGALTGSGDLSKVGTGILALSNTASHTYTGDIYLSEGTLQLVGTGSDALRTNLDISSGATLNMNSRTESVNQITGSGSIDMKGTYISGAGYIPVGSSLTVGDAGDFTYSGDITGAGTFKKTGSGTMSLEGGSDYYGQTTIESGTLKISHASALGQTGQGGTSNDDLANQTIVSLATTLALTGDIIYDAESLSLNGDGKDGVGALYNLSGDNTWQGKVRLFDDSTIGVNDSSTLTVTGVISQNNDLTKNGGGELILEAENTYSGVTIIDDGIMQLNNSGGESLTATTDIVINDGGTLLLNQDDQIWHTGSAGAVTAGANMELNAGTFDTGGHSDILGSLSLTANSTINMGDAASKIEFMSLDSYTSGSVLTVTEWSGTQTTGGGTDQIFIGTDLNDTLNANYGVYQDFLASVYWSELGIMGAVQLGTNEIIPIAPVPEPSTYVGLGCLALFIGYDYRRRKRAKRKELESN